MKTKSRHAINKMAKKFALSMAWSRKDFGDNIESFINGALGEFYKSKLAEKNGYATWVTHWMSEAKRLIELEFRHALQHSTKTNFDRRAVYSAVKAERLTKDAQFRLYAERVVKRDFQTSKLKSTIDETDTSAFWNMVDATVDAVLP